jgi:hypothetical protein
VQKLDYQLCKGLPSLPCHLFLLQRNLVTGSACLDVGTVRFTVFYVKRSDTLLPTDGCNRREFLHKFALPAKSVCTVNFALSYLKVYSLLLARSCFGYRTALTFTAQSAAHVRMSTVRTYSSLHCTKLRSCRALILLQRQQMAQMTTCSYKSTKFTLEQATKAQRGSRGTVIHFL